MITISLEKLKENLEGKQSDNSYYNQGLFRAIEAAHYELKSTDVNWDSFTLQDAETALEHAMEYVDYERIESENGSDENVDQFPNEGNAIHEFMLTCDSVYALKKAQPERVTAGVQFF